MTSKISGRAQKRLTPNSHYVISGAICFLFVATRYFFPDYYDNEWAYTLGPIRIVNPNFLINDSFIGGISSTFSVYNIIVSPLYLFLSYLNATLVCRLSIWAFQIWALLRLSRTVGLSWWASVLLFVLWLDVEQTLVAGEWIIECATAKPVAYGFVFLALDSLLKEKLKLSGVFCGLAISFHLAVGIWSALALSAAILMTRYKNMERKEILLFCGSGAMLSLPGLLPALKNMLRAGPEVNIISSGAEAAKVSVLVANPFHLDPAYFMSGLEHLKVVLFFIITLILLRHLLSEGTARIFTAFIVFLFAVFVAGFVARYFEGYSFLQYYPFRVMDAFLPLSFWMGVTLLFQKVFYKLQKKKIALIFGYPGLDRGR